MTKGSHDPGALRHRVELQSRLETMDGSGGLVVAWQPVTSLWAQIEPQRSERLLEADQQVERLSHHITIRFRIDVQSGWRFVMSGRSFAVLQVFDADETRRYLTCICEEEGR